jgi:hypothetical protein
MSLIAPKKHESVLYFRTRSKKRISTFDYRFVTRRSRQRLLGLLFIFSFSLLILNCGLDIEDPTPPSPPVWVQKSLPEEWPERGIDAHESGYIYLEWEPNPEEDIVAYNVYRAIWSAVNDSLGAYELLARRETESVPPYEYLDNQAITGVKYFYTLKAEDASGNTSKYSESIFYLLLQPISAQSMNPNNDHDRLNNQRILRWYYGSIIEMEDYCLTILSQANSLITRVRILPGNYVDGQESWGIPTDIELESGEVYQWRIDLGANYIEGYETAGSETPWATFIYADD